MSNFNNISPKWRSFGPDTDYGPHNQGNGLIALVHTFAAAQPAVRAYMEEIVTDALKTVLHTNRMLSAERPMSCVGVAGCKVALG